MPDEHDRQPEEDLPPARPGAGSPWQGVVAGHDGDGDGGRPGKGAVPVRQLRVEGPDGRSLEFGHRPPPGARAVRVRTVRDIGFHRFGTCPICLSPGPSTREHVPPSSLGGNVATLVCARCNNDLGSRVEVALLDWRDGAVRRPRVSGGSVTGLRRIGRLLTRTTPDGEFVLVPEGRTDPALRDIVAAGKFELTVTPPDPRLVGVAALKHAYLAACVDSREIPDVPSARQIRRELVAFRDAPRGEPAPDCDFARSLPLMRSYAGPGGPPLAVCLADTGRYDVNEEVWILLAGGVAVPWPMHDFPPVL